MNDIVTQIKAFYEGLEPRRQKVLIGAVALCLMVLVAVGLWSNQERYDTVYSSADPRQVQATAAALEATGIIYRVSRDGTRLEVPSDQLGAARLEAAVSGQPTGLDILSSIELGSSPQQERWFRGYALQQEIQSSINSMDVVQASRVHIVQPDRVNFFSRDTAASASVILQLSPGTELSRRQIAGVASMVSGAVHGLETDDVSLVDTAGNLLHPTSDEGAGMFANVSEREQSEEGALRAKILEALLPMFGHPRHIAAAVTVELENASVTRSEIAYDSNSGVPISTDYREEDRSDSSSARGTPGVESNLPEQASESRGGTKNSTLEERINYKYDETHTKKVIPAGRIRRVSSSVTIDARALQRLIDSSGGSENLESLQQKVSELTRGAVGFDNERGDTLMVEFIPFIELEVEEVSPISTATWHLRQFLPSLVTGLAVVLFFIFIVRPVVNRMVNPAAMSPDGDENEDEAVVRNESASELVERMRELAEGASTIDAAELNRLTSNHEEPAAAVLRRWLKAS